MNRTVLAGLGTAAVLALAACSSNASKPTAAPAVTTTTTAVTTPAPTCQPGPDMLERVVIPGQAATAQDLGSVNLGTCQTLIQELPATAANGPGDCTQIAWASDNPGYNADAVPAPPLKKVVESAGPGC